MSAPEPTRAPSLPLYWPALDGLRALAVVAVLLFHSGYSWARGGYLGVSTFFTLSGFLITSLLLTERDATGGIVGRRFWARRFRRLMPAALAALGLAVLFGATVADPEQVRELRGDIIACLAYVANWRFIFEDQSYADLFAAPSPVLHFWSLAIEEQFYLLFPLLTMGLLTWTRGSRRALAATLVVLAAGSVALTRFAGFSHDRIYFGTDTRAAELLAGALLAVAVCGRPLPRAARGAATVAGPAILAVVLWAMATVPQDSPGLYEGGLALFSLASTGLVLAATQPSGPVVTLLGRRPLVALGRISYGVYLYHWVVFLWLTPARTGLRGSAGQDALLLALRVAVTVALAAASFVLLEQPIRRGRVLHGRAPFVAAPAAIAVVAVAVVVVTLSPPPPLIDFAAAEEALDQSTDPFVAPATVDPAGDARPDAPTPRISVFGDSTALMTAAGLFPWMDDTGLAVPAGNNTFIGCGLGRGGERINGPAGESEAPEGCDQWASTWADDVAEQHPDLAVILVGPWEVTDRRLEGDDTWRAPGDPIYDDYLRGEMRTATDVLASAGAEVVWLTSPPIGEGASGQEIAIRGEAADPSRMDRFNEILREVVAERPGDAHVVDLAAWVASTGEDTRLREDGVHFGEDTTREVADDFLGPALVRLWREDWTAEWVAAHDATDDDPLRMLLVGDSTAFMLGWGLSHYVQGTASVDMASLASLDGCGLVVEGRHRYQGQEGDVPPACAELWDEWRRSVDTYDPDVVIVLTGPWDVADHRLPGDDEWRAPGDPVYDAHLHDQYQAATDLLSANGALVVWLSSPHIHSGLVIPGAPPEGFPESEPARMDRLNEIIHAIVDADPDAELADYAGRLAGSPGGEMDTTLRPDGIHLDADRAYVIGDWLGPELVDLHRTWLTDRWVAEATADLEQ